MKTMKPFEAASSTTVSGVTFETDEDSLVISGSTEIRKDAKGLETVQRMIAVLQSAADALKSVDLPDEAPSDRPDGPRIANPFA